MPHTASNNRQNRCPHRQQPQSAAPLAKPLWHKRAKHPQQTAIGKADTPPQYAAGKTCRLYPTALLPSHSRFVPLFTIKTVFYNCFDHIFFYNLNMADFYKPTTVRKPIKKNFIGFLFCNIRYFAFWGSFEQQQHCCNPPFVVLKFIYNLLFYARCLL